MIESAQAYMVTPLIRSKKVVKKPTSKLMQPFLLRHAWIKVPTGKKKIILNTMHITAYILVIGSMNIFNIYLISLSVVKT